MTGYEQRLLDALPHRPPFRFLSDVLRLEPGESGQAVWRVSGDESFFAGHFPGQPVVPGVLIAEALAQLSGLVGFLRGDEALQGESKPRSSVKKQGKLAHVDIRFDVPVRPPAELFLQSHLQRVFGKLRQFDVEARHDDRVVARGHLTLVEGPEDTEAAK